MFTLKSVAPKELSVGVSITGGSWYVKHLYIEGFFQNYLISVANEIRYIYIYTANMCLCFLKWIKHDKGKSACIHNFTGVEMTSFW